MSSQCQSSCHLVNEKFAVDDFPSQFANPALGVTDFEEVLDHRVLAALQVLKQQPHEIRRVVDGEQHVLVVHRRTAEHDAQGLACNAAYPARADLVQDLAAGIQREHVVRRHGVPGILELLKHLGQSPGSGVARDEELEQLVTVEKRRDFQSPVLRPAQHLGHVGREQDADHAHIVQVEVVPHPEIRGYEEGVHVDYLGADARS